MREPTVALAHSQRGWARDLHFFLMDHGGAVVRGYVVGPEDALGEDYDVLIVDDITSFLTPRLVSSLQRRGTSVIGVFDPADGDGAGKQRLIDLGVDEALADDAGAAAMLEAISRLAGAFVADDTEIGGLLAELRRDPARHRPAEEPAPRGVIVAVAGAGGGVGATEVAVATADAFRRGGSSVVLVDTDEIGPSVAQRLGLPIHPNLRTAVDVVHHASGELEATLAREPSLGIEILAGIPNHRDWHELRATEVVEVLRDLSSTRAVVVANVGPRVEDLPDFGGPARYGVSRAVLDLADVVVLVGGESPVGVTRMVDWLADARTLLDGTPVHVVVNRHDGSRYVASEIENELRRSFTPESIHFAPVDKKVARAAWDGVGVAKGPFTRAVAQLVSVLERVGVRR